MGEMARDRRTSELYVGSFGELTKRRDALARALRDEGDAEGAARVKALKKPPISAWAVTQLLASEARRIDALLDAGDAARGALGDVLGGADPATLRARMDALREGIEALTTRAAAIIEGETGRAPGDAVMSRVSDDLRALALSPGGRAQVERGYLEEDLAPPGLDALGAVAMPAAPVARLRTKQAAARRAAETREHVRVTDERARARQEAQRQRDEERARRDEERARSEAAAEEARREEEARRARARRAEQEARREATRRAADEARARRAKLRAEAQELAREADRAEELAREARRRADEARRAVERLER